MQLQSQVISSVDSPQAAIQHKVTSKCTIHILKREFLIDFCLLTLDLPNPNPPVPDHLVMPDFSQRPGGFGTGATASDLSVWIYVIEEWNTCTVRNKISISWAMIDTRFQPTIGNNIWVASVQAVYNATY